MSYRRVATTISEMVHNGKGLGLFAPRRKAGVDQQALGTQLCLTYCGYP
jgi:hypothetical protein